jgi:hypothetical protein
MMKQLSHIVYRILFAASFLMAGIVFLEKLVNFSGYTFLGDRSPWRMLELTAVALLFVIALQLREMKISSGK